MAGSSLPSSLTCDTLMPRPESWRPLTVRSSAVQGIADHTAVLSSIQIGKPASYGSRDAIDPRDKPWTTGFFKAPVEGPVFAARTNLAGDGQADLENHGGIDKAVLAYSADHYPNWRIELGMPDLPHGAFGENLTIAGLG